MKRNFTVRRLIDAYAPPGKAIPILLGEWGYSSASGEVDEKTRADYLVRQSLLGILYGSPVDIWYDWKGDIQGNTWTDSKEQRFGLVNTALQPSPAWFALRELSQNLTGQRFTGRMPSQPDDYLLTFSDGPRSTLVGWTCSVPHWTSVGSTPVLLTGKPFYKHTEGAWLASR